MGSVYSTNTSSSFSAIFTTKRNWDKEQQLGWRRGAASTMPGRCAVAVPTTQGRGLCHGASCDSDGQRALGRDPEQDPLTQVLCPGAESHQDGELWGCRVTSRWVGAGANTPKDTRVLSAEARAG